MRSPRCGPDNPDITYKSFPKMAHSMHGQDPQLFADTLIEWVDSLP